VRIIVVSVDDGLWFQFHPHLIKDGDTFHPFSNPVLDSSDPMYITHYPLIYLYTAWVGDKHLSLAQSYPGALLVFFGSFVLAYACLKLYDEPARNWLKRRFLVEPKANVVPSSRQ